MTVRPAHPYVDGRRSVLSNINHPVGSSVFVDNREIPLRLNNLKRKRQIGGARYTRQITFDLRIQCQPVGEVLLLFCCCPWLVRNLIPVDDASPAGNGTDRAKLMEQSRLRRMVLNIPMGGAERLPHPSQVWLAVWHPWNRCCLCLTRSHAECEQRHRYKSRRHSRLQASWPPWHIGSP